MKKLVVLMLVVGMASLASAAITLSNQGGAWTVNVDGTTATQFAINVGAQVGGPQDGWGENYSGYIWINYPATGGYNTQLNGNAAFTGNVTADPLNIINTTYQPLGGIGVIVATNSGNQLIVAGDIFVFDMVAAAGAIVGDTYNLRLQTASFVDIDSVIVTVVPEPMTMALLGLGGLFLRRKK